MLLMVCRNDIINVKCLTSVGQELSLGKRKGVWES